MKPWAVGAERFLSLFKGDLMEPIFTLSYSEYSVISELSHYLKKKDGYTCYVPASRQEKGVDFIFRNSKTGKHLSFQVKGSRSYAGEKDGETWHSFWFNNFIKRYELGVADFYILFGIYPTYSQKVQVTSKNKHWRSMILCFDDNEMGRTLRSIRTKTDKPDSFFSIWLDSSNCEPIGGRGFRNDPNLTEHLLENKVSKIKKASKVGT